MDFDELYRPAALKIGRASQHIAELEARIAEFLDRKAFELFLLRDEAAGKRTHNIARKEQIPDDLPLIIGDAVHNLRSALNVTVFGMIGSQAKQSHKVQFPFSYEQEGLNRAIASAELELAGRDVVSCVEKAKPFSGGNSLLHGLHVLDVRDKHRLILLVGTATKISADNARKNDPDLPFVGGGILSFKGSLDTIFTIEFPDPGRRVRRASRRVKPVRIVARIQPDFGIVFGDNQPFARQEVIPTLEAIRGEVESLSRNLCEAFLST
jgi:hypothetical protein